MEPIISEVWVEEHQIHGNGVPFAPRTVYWVRARMGERLSPLITEVYSRQAAYAVARELASISLGILLDSVPPLTCS